MNIKKKEKPSIKSAGARISYLRGMCSISRSDFSQLSKISYDSLKYLEKPNTVSIKLEIAEKIVNTFETLGIKCSVNWLLHGADEPPHFIYPTNHTNHNIDYEDGTNNLREAEFFHTINKNSTSLIITDKSMFPLLEPGDIVAGIKKVDDEIKIKALDKLCIVESIEGIKLARKLTSSSISQTYNLEPLNNSIDEHFPKLTNVKLAYAAPIIWHRKKDI